MAKSLNSLPDALVNCVFQDWLNLIDLAKIDAALCNHTVRKWYQEVMLSLKVTYVPPRLASKEFYDWISARKIKLKYLVVTLSTLSHLVRPFPMSTDLVESIVFGHGEGKRQSHPPQFYETTSHQLAQLCDSCPKLTSLQMATPMPGALETFSSAILDRLTSLAISSDLTAHGYTTTMLSAIKEKCKNLISFTFNMNVSEMSIIELNDSLPSLVDVCFMSVSSDCRTGAIFTPLFY